MMNMQTDVSFVICLTKLLKNKYVGSIFQKIKKLNNVYVIKFYKKGIGTFVFLIWLDGFLIITKKSLLENSTQDYFSQKCNKELKNSFIIDVKQLNNDRIIEITFSNNKKIILELFKKGNIILLNPDDKILSCAIERKMKDRYVTVNQQYKPPPKPKKLPDYIEKFDLDCSKTYIYKQVYTAFACSDDVIEKPLLEFIFEEKLKELLLEKKETKESRILDSMKKSLENLEIKIQDLENKIKYIEQHYPELEILINKLNELGLENIEKCNEYLKKISKGKAELKKEGKNIYLIIKYC